MTSPFQAALAVYESEPCKRSFWDDMTLHLMSGFVYSTPDFFVMGRPVLSTALPMFVVDPRVKYERHQADCWHVYLMAGDMRKAWDILPWEYPLISFERLNKLRFYDLAEVRRLSKELSAK